MFRMMVTLAVNLWTLTRFAMGKIVKSVTGRLRRRGRTFVRIKLPAGLELSSPPRKVGPVTVGVASDGHYWQFVETLRRVARDRHVDGVYFRAGGTHLGLAEIDVLSNALAELRAAGKRVVCHLEQAMLLDYLLACSADLILMSPPGRLYTFGLRMDLRFAGEALDKIGLRAQFIHVGRFKTAAHRFTKGEATPSQTRMMRQLMDGLSASVAERIATGRGVDLALAKRLFDASPISAREARNMGLVDVCAYRDQVVEILEAERDDERKVKITAEANYIKSMVPFKWRPVLRKPPKIAVLSLSGMIMMGNEGALGQLRRVITPKPVIALLRQIRKDDDVKAVVLHIDSPGGAALASDLIWRHVAKLAKKKPVVAHLGNVAASGGYYIAVGATKIVALPDSLTGSIGVIAGKISGGELLDRLGVASESITMGATSSFTSLTEPLSDTEFDNLHSDIRAFYRRFIQRVAEGRGLETRRVHRLARGRVFLGAHAKLLGLVDTLGDLESAIDLACRLAEVRRDRAQVEFRHTGPTGLGGVIKNLRGSDTVAGTSLFRPELTELLPEVLHQRLALAELLRRPTVLTLWPWLAGPTA